MQAYERLAKIFDGGNVVGWKNVQDHMNDMLNKQPIHDQQRAFVKTSKFKQNLQEWDEWLEEKRRR